MQERFPETEENEAAAEGTASHWVASEVLASYLTPGSVLCPNSFIDQISPNGVLITEEMAEGANVYILHVLLIAQKFGLLQSMYVEKSVFIRRIHNQMFGTPDCVLWDQKNFKLYIFDYKYGRRYVSIFECWQLMAYAVGVLDEMTGGNGLVDQAITVEMVIVQPRTYTVDSPVRSWTIPASDLRGYANQMKAACDAALSEHPPLASGSHCRDCSALHVCPAAQQAAYNAVDVSTSLTPVEMSNAAIGTELVILQRASEALKERLVAMEAQALALSKKNSAIPGFIAEQGYGNKKWDKPLDEVISLGKMLGLDLSKPAAITPTQAIALGMDEGTVNSYSKRPHGKVKLVRSKLSKAALIFGDIKSEENT